MEDKDLDNYFKDRSSSFNEAPGEGLWAKIEANIAPPVQSGFKAGKWLLPGAGFVVVAGLVAAWLVTRNTPKKPAARPQQPQQISVVSDSAAPVTETVITVRDTIAPVFKAQAIKTGKNQVTVKEPAPALATANATQTDEFFDGGNGEDTKPNANATASPVPLQTYSVKSKGDTIATPGKKSIPYNFELDENKDVMEITITQKISLAERNALIKSTIESNAPYVGRKIVIKAKGYRIYRHTISQADYKMHQTLKDSAKTNPGLKIEVLADTIYHNLNQDSLTPATIRFENKPAKKE
jgi:hypothetical protein